MPNKFEKNLIMTPKMLIKNKPYINLSGLVMAAVCLIKPNNHVLMQKRQGCIDHIFKQQDSNVHDLWELPEV